jgi:hypothetical protein
MVLVPGHDQVHAVPVEQRQPLLPDPEVSAVEVGRGHRDLVHAHDDPVDIAVLPCGCQFLFQPDFLLSPRITPHIRIAAILVCDVVVGDANHPDRASSEGVPQAARHIGLA